MGGREVEEGGEGGEGEEGEEGGREGGREGEEGVKLISISPQAHLNLHLNLTSILPHSHLNLISISPQSQLLAEPADLPVPRELLEPWRDQQLIP